MPTGPHGEKRPKSTVANAVHVMKIATGEVEEELTEPKKSVMAEYLEEREKTKEQGKEEVPA